MGRRADSGGRDGMAGVTLIEMLVVLSIISIAAGVLVLQFSGPTASDATSEAEGLAEVLTRAGETALYSGNPSALIWSQTGYHVERFLPGPGWQIATGETPHDLASGLTLARGDGMDGGPEGALMIAPGGIALPASFVLTQSDGSVQVDFNGLSANVNQGPGQGTATP